MRIHTCTYHYQIDYQCFFKQWYDQAAQPENISFVLNGILEQTSLII